MDSEHRPPASMRELTSANADAIARRPSAFTTLRANFMTLILFCWLLLMIMGDMKEEVVAVTAAAEAPNCLAMSDVGWQTREIRCWALKM